MLNFIAQGNKTNPALVFLHGFLGSSQDWSEVIALISEDYYCVAIDLPAHAASGETLCIGFDDCCDKLIETINKAIPDQTYYLVGYSLGGRLGMYLAAQKKPSKLRGLIVESSHLGLRPENCAARWQQDQSWAKRFSFEPLTEVVQDWYQQAIFATLTEEQKSQLVAKRVKTNISTQALAAMLMATSLSKQPRFNKHCFAMPVLYLCGEADAKFTAIAINSGLQYKTIKNAGHNVHFEQSRAYVEALIRWLTIKERTHG